MFNKNFSVIKLLSGNFVSFLGDQLYLLAIPIIIYRLTGSALAMGIVAALERIPVFFQPLAGSLADRFDRRKLLMISDFCRSLTVGMIGILFILDNLEIWQLYVGSLLLGWFTQLHYAAEFSIIPSLVERKDLQTVNAIDSGLFQTAIFIGPGLGGIIISLFKPGYALLFNSVSFLATFVVIYTISMDKIHSQRSKQEVSYFKMFFQDVKEGFSYVIQTKEILYTNLALMISTFGTTMFLTLLVFHLQDEAGLSPSQIGWLLSLGGMSAIAGSLLTGVLIKYFSYKNILIYSHFIGGTSIILLGWSSTYIWLVVTNAIGVIAASLINPCIRTIRQTYADNKILGRVQATSRFMTWSLLPVSSLIAGIIANQFGTGLTIMIAGVISTMAVLVFFHPVVRRLTF